MINRGRFFAENEICPHMGCRHDEDIRYMFPNELHVCLHTTPPGKISLLYQEKVCLTLKHQQCPLFKEAIDGPIPARIGRKKSRSTMVKGSKRPVFLTVVAILIIGGMIGMILFKNGKETTQSAAALEVPTITATPTISAKTETPEPTPTKTMMPSATPTRTIKPTASKTVGTPTTGPDFGTPFGNYVLHRVQNGESLAIIAKQYQIAIEQIEAANPLRDSRTVWPEDILVIPLAATPEAEVQFVVILVETDTALADLAKDHTVTVEDLREYNRLGPLDWVPAGRWLIFPLAGE